MEITLFSKMKKWYLLPCKWAKTICSILLPYVRSRAIGIFNKQERFNVTNECHLLADSHSPYCKSYRNVIFCHYRSLMDRTCIKQSYVKLQLALDATRWYSAFEQWVNA
jgi:hypothetical protein